MDLRLAVVVALFSFLQLDVTSGEYLRCYRCNTDLRDGHERDCNDPYVPGHSAELVSCPREEPHHCLKSIVTYRSVLVTVRGCVPSRKIKDYCRHEDSFPDSNIECYFCKDYACNRVGSMKIYRWNLALAVAVPIFLLKMFI